MTSKNAFENIVFLYSLLVIFSYVSLYCYILLEKERRLCQCCDYRAVTTFHILPNIIELNCAINTIITQSTARFQVSYKFGSDYDLHLIVRYIYINFCILSRVMKIRSLKCKIYRSSNQQIT